MTTTMHAVPPSFALLVALLLTGMYMVVGMVAFGYASPDLRAKAKARPLRFDPWWPFHSAGFEPSGQRLCGLGKVLLVLAAIGYLAWAWGVLRALTLH